MEKVKELEKELKAKGEELDRVEKAREDLRGKRDKNRWDLDKWEGKRPLVFGEVALQKGEIVKLWR